MPWKMTDEDDDYDGPWPSEENAVKPTVEGVLSLVRDFGAARLRCVTGARGHRYEDAVRALDAVYDSIRAALEALSSPHKTDRWNIDEMSDGSLSVCKGEHAGSDPCEPVLYVPATEAVLKAPLSMDGKPAAPVQAQAEIEDGEPEPDAGDLLIALEQTMKLRDELLAENERLRAELERERMRLAACGVVALANTPESAASARTMHADYHSGSLDSVIGAVDREMRLRAALDSIRQYGSDTLSGRTDGPDDRKWQRDAVLEMTNRASRALKG